MTAPWVALSPVHILGTMPFSSGPTPVWPIPFSVVPADARGLLVFAWVRLAGPNPVASYWHMTVTVAGSATNWFSLLVPGDPSGRSVTGASQAFWLPVPMDRRLAVSLHTTGAMSAANMGQVEIHGYSVT